MNNSISNKTIKGLVLVTILLVVNEVVFSQKDYHRGYIITNDSDTLYGLVKDRKPQPFGEIYKKIRFRDKGLFAKKLAPDHIKGYNNGTDRFESLWLDARGNFFREDYFSIPGSGERQFLKIISKGYLSYYHMEYVDPESFYIDFIPFFKREDETNLVRVTQGILGLKKKILAEYFIDCPELVEKILNKEINEPYEVALIYNSWKKNY